MKNQKKQHKLLKKRKQRKERKQRKQKKQKKLHVSLKIMVAYFKLTIQLKLHLMKKKNCKALPYSTHQNSVYMQQMKSISLLKSLKKPKVEDRLSKDMQDTSKVKCLVSILQTSRCTQIIVFITQLLMRIHVSFQIELVYLKQVQRHGMFQKKRVLIQCYLHRFLGF